MQRIAIFQYEWPILSYTANLAKKLAENGYIVDYFAADCSTDFFDFDDISKNPNFHLHTYTSINNPLFENIIARKLSRYVPFKWTSQIISNDVFHKSLTIIEQHSYKCLIGIEKKGLIWAGKISEQCSIPYLYYSLELYIEDIPEYRNNKVLVELRLQEKKYHKMSKATIIQDADRAEVLLRANEINQTNLIYVPISVLGDTNEKRYNYFNDTFNIGIDKKIILCLGLITKNRLSHELADVARSLDDAYIMILHGPGEKEEIKQLAVKFSSSNLIISDKLVPHSLMKIMISSAHVGLVFFDKINANNRLTAFSSEKIALYLQSGIPIIGLDMGNYRRLMNRYHCGELVSEFKELPEAINKIMNNHASYSRNAYLAYREIYSLEKHVQSIQKYLEKMND